MVIFTADSPELGNSKLLSDESMIFINSTQQPPKSISQIGRSVGDKGLGLEIFRTDSPKLGKAKLLSNEYRTFINSTQQPPRSILQIGRSVGDDPSVTRG